MAVKLRALGHPVHPPLTDFPVVLLLAATVCDVGGALQDSGTLWQVGYWALVLGLLSALPTAVTGLIDFASAPDSASGTAYAHLYTVMGAITCYSTSLLVRWTAAPPVDGARRLVLACEILGALTLGAAGWFGGHLVFHHGVGSDRGA
jgi:uncharacterized membrane protein